jgi:hypothetical protein
VTPLAAIAIAAAAVSIHVEEARDVTPEETERLSRTLAEMIRASDRAVEDGGAEVLALALQGAPTKIRVLAELRPSSPEKKLILDVPRDERAWREALEPLVLDFFPPRSPPAAAAAEPPPPAAIEPLEENRFGPWPYVALGVSAVSAGTALAFGLASKHARDRIEHDALEPGELEALRDSANDRAFAANVLIAGAVAAATGAVVLWVLED